MIIAITGGTGFIGSQLVFRHVSAGDTVRVLSRRMREDIDLPNEAKVYGGDLTNPADDFRNFVEGADVLYHCAGELQDCGRMRVVHVGGTRNLINAAGGRIGHWVQLSSVGAYGPHRHGIVTEETPGNPVATYEKTKTESDVIVMEAADKGAFSFTILRPSNVYGPRMRNHSLFQLISMINRGAFFFIGKPGASANYIHVDNVTEALYRCGVMATAKGRVYNLSDYRKLEEFVRIIADELDVPFPRLRIPEAPVRLAVKLLGGIPRFPLTEARINAMVNRSQYAIERIQSDLEYYHPVSMNEGVRQLVRAWKRDVTKSDSVSPYPVH